MTNKELILKSIQFIESNLKNKINTIEISQEACYSLYHFIRLFKSITGYSPKNYILQRRLSSAALELQNTSNKISNIAYDYQFGSPAAFSRAFKKHFKINPLEARSNNFPLTSLPLLNPIDSNYIYHSDQLKNKQPQIIQREEKTLVGISFFIKNDCKVDDLSKEWAIFSNEIQKENNLIQPAKYYQIQYWSDSQDIDGMYFFLGAEVSTIDSINPLFVIKTIPRSQYLQFIHKGRANRVGYTYEYIYNQYLPNTSYRLNKPFNFELYGERYLGPFDDNSESEIYIPIE
ncbi:MAG: helix-turn-helix domain-containing protein [Hyphomicrobiales bacterium]